jgi:hypothetical protein
MKMTNTQTNTDLMKVCAWCGKVMAPGALLGGQPSHGICPPCKRKAFPTAAAAAERRAS